MMRLRMTHALAWAVIAVLLAAFYQAAMAHERMGATVTIEAGVQVVRGHNDFIIGPPKSNLPAPMATPRRTTKGFARGGLARGGRRR